MEILAKILGSVARVKVMRLFLLNKGIVFNTKDIALRSRVGLVPLRRELKVLAGTGFVKKTTKGWSFNQGFKYTNEFEGLLLSTDTIDPSAIIDTFKKVGRLKFLVVSGLFIKNKESRVDLLIVGDKLNRSKIEDGIKKLEAEIGAELMYAIFETQDFIYRLNMYDKLVRDILDFPHEVILQSKELSPQALKRG